MYQMKFGNLIFASLTAACVAFSAFAQGLPKAGQPEDVGFSSGRLKRIASVFQGEVDKGVIPGAVILIARDGKVADFEAIGFQDREKKIPMGADSIFRIASMSKPITSVALMMLVEEGKIQLENPLSDYLPEFKGGQVGVEKVNEATGKPELSLEPAKREMTIQDLLRHTSGLTYGFLGKSLVKQAYLDTKLDDPGQTLAVVVTKISKLPLAAQPGTTWDYGMSTDVLGQVIEVVSGEPFDQFIRERIAKPLGLSDTDFYVPGENAVRVAEPQADPTTNKRPDVDDVTSRDRWPSGGGGMVSTAADYARIQPDAVERRSARRRAAAVAAHGRVHDLGSTAARRRLQSCCVADYGAGGTGAHPQRRPGFRARVRGAHASGAKLPRRFTRGFLLAWLLGHGFLGRSQGKACRGLHDAGAAAAADALHVGHSKPGLPSSCQLAGRFTLRAFGDW